MKNQIKAMNESNTKALALGVVYIETIGNPNVNFVTGAVELHEAEGLEDSFRYEGYEDGLIAFSYAYPEGEPISDTQTKNYALPVYLHDPGILHPIEGVLPVLQLEVYNRNNPEETEKGDVITAQPVKLDDPIPEINEPRCVILETSDSDGNASTEYFIFVVVRTDANHTPVLITQDGEVNGNILMCSYQDAENPPVPSIAPVAAIAYQATELNAYTQVDIEGNRCDVDYEATESFQYNSVS